MADMDDLQWALNRESYADADDLKRFHEIIRQAMLTAKPGGSRHGTWKENEIAHEIAPTMKESGDPDAKEDDDDSGLGY